MRNRMIRNIILLFLIVTFSAGVVRANIVGDFNNDGKVNIFDVIALLKIISGRQPAGDVGKSYVLADQDSSQPGGQLPTDVIQGITLVNISSDSFLMGAASFMMGNMFMHSGPMHSVVLDGFWMGSTEITQGQYRTVMGFDPAIFTGSDSLPVEGVSWLDAIAFCNRLSDAAGFETSYDLATGAVDYTKNGFRLPTEAEWEFAARAGTRTMFYTGDSESDMMRAGWYFSNSEGVTHPVGEKEANAWGLYDMLGNVAEWCYDWFGDNYYASSPGQNPPGPSTGQNRVVRGGSWNDLSSYCASASRYSLAPDSTSRTVGFRVVRRP